MIRSRLIGIPTAVAALTLGALASADPASAEATSSWQAFARYSTSAHIYQGTGPSASQAKSKAMTACKVAHRPQSWKCQLMQLRKVS